MPSTGPCALIFEGRRRTMIVEIPEEVRRPLTNLASRRSPIVVKWYEPATLRLRMLGPDGSPVPGRSCVSWAFGSTGADCPEVFLPPGEPPPPRADHEIRTGLCGPLWV